ncbi:hypothetical protein [Pelagibacterium luteolum]|uniref:Uncharacterized protein n=1 Tax=Pelagibacterium luteolum TaxID=440168 RepID=A0A1G7YWB8_9HYPH|nr:hypothetical protein [Pelagibacterium luteolum]SDH00803.1 hypothetical protein SAMN04487974_11624 [Pelagibacterium luteolum]
MPAFTVETTYRLPAYRHRTYHAETPAEACRLAIEDDDWEGEKLDYECAGETYVTGIWSGTDAAYSAPAIAVPSHFEETIHRKAAHFELLLGLLKMMVADAVARRASPEGWVERASWAVGCGEAILAGARDPDAPVVLPKPSHVLAWLSEERVHDQITAILETDPVFAGVSVGDVTDDDVHTACLAVASAADLFHEKRFIEFKAALAALEPAVSRVRNR